MNNENKNFHNVDLLLKEILPVPAEKVIEDRFTASADSEQAGCSGNCSSPGGCRGSAIDG